METIYSLVTKPINQNVGIIRISGPDTFSVVKKMFPDIKLRHSTVEFHKLFLDNEFIDDVLVLIFKSPNSFTGEDVIEIQSHGSMYVIKQIISYLEKNNLVQSEPGEFMKQAFFNGKIDLLKSESINELILADSNLLAKKASKNLNNAEGNVLRNILKKLEDIISLIQVSIDYPENTDLPKYSYEGIKEKLLFVIKDIEKILKNSKKLIKSSKGIKIVFIGFPNAGKSTLLNSILKEERVITSNIAGTTRDTIESTIYINDIKVTFIDTAGIRDKGGVLELKSIKKTIESIEKADLVSILIDSTKDIKKQENEIFSKINIDNKKNIIKVLTKWDKLKNKEKLLSNLNDNYLKISALNNQIDELINYFESFIKNEVIDFDDEEKAILISSFQISNLEIIFYSLKKVLNFLEQKETFDLIGYEIENSIDSLKKILGIKKDPNYLEELFGRFCIGK